MKKTFIISGFLLCFLILISGNMLFAQKLETAPEIPLKGAWYAETPSSGIFSPKSADPFISAFVSQVSADSLRATLRWLQNMGTRFLAATNKKEVVNLLVRKFKSYGYSDAEVKLDSFFLAVRANIGGLIFQDSSYQYNVICTLRGATAPGENYVVGGHYDSFCYEHSYDTAPGVDDNGTAVAATFEIARIMKKMNYHPEATVKFSLFAAEELGLFGSGYQAQEARTSSEDIRYMLNMDMIANNPDSLNQVKIYQYLYGEWAGKFAADCFQRYTNLEVFVPQGNIPSGTDSYSYWVNGFPATSLEEIAFSPNWHKLSDTVGNCNLEYLAEITKGSLATLMEQQSIPIPQNLRATSSKDAITLQWKPTGNGRVQGYNIYRSENISTHFIRINETGLVADSTYADLVPEAGRNYYYKVRSVNDSLQESYPSTIAWGSRFAFTDSLLVVACLGGVETTPDSIRNYYQSVLDTIPYQWFDLNKMNPLDLGTLARHQNVLWLINSMNFDDITDTVANNLFSFFQNKGNMLFSGFTPSKYFDWNANYPIKNPDYSLLRNFFKVDSVNRKVPCFMFRANPSDAGYDTLRVDKEKYTQSAYPGEIHNLEVFTPTGESKAIYTLDSHYSTSSPLGTMKGKNVGIEYKGTDYATIMLSFPLYYMDTMDARNFIQYVMKEKFSHPTGTNDQKPAGNTMMLQNHPNPFSEITTVTFSLDNPVHVNLRVYDMHGSVVARLLDRKMESGKHTLDFRSAGLPSGIYQMVMTTPDHVSVRKMVIIR